MSIILLYKHQIISNELSALVTKQSAFLVNSQAVVTTSTMTTNRSNNLPSTINTRSTNTASSSLMTTTPPVKIVVAENKMPQALSPTPTVHSSMPTLPTPKVTTSRLAASIHSLTNNERTDNDLPSLLFDTALAKLAKARSEDMIALNYFSHTSLQGCNLECAFKSAGYISKYGGENLAEMTSYASLSDQQLSQSFVHDWLKSSGHKENLLSSKFTSQGIGVASNGKRIVVTVIFSQ